MVFPDPESEVEGSLIRGLDRRGATALDAFESDEYDRISCPVVVASGRSVEAWTYAAGRRAVPSPIAWDLAAWQKRHKRDLRRRIG